MALHLRGLDGAGKRRRLDPSRLTRSGRPRGSAIAGTVAALLIIGAPGAGKSSALQAISSRWEREGREFGALESEQLAQGNPLLAASDWLPQLAAVLALQRGAGRRLFLIVATPESASDLEGARAAIDADEVLVTCLRATPDVLARRLDDRESDSWPGKPALIARARALADLIPAMPGIDLTIDSGDRDTESVADDLVEALEARGLIDRA